MGLVLIGPPGIEPVSIDDVNAHLRLDTDLDIDEEVALGRMISASRRAAERNAAISIPLQTWRLTAPGFPVATGYIPLRRGPVQSLVVNYLDADGNALTLDASAYVLESTPLSDRLSLVAGETWPVTAVQADAVRAEYVAGYADNAVPDDLIAAILLGVEDLYRNRGAQSTENLVPNRRICDLLDGYRREYYDAAYAFGR